MRRALLAFALFLPLVAPAQTPLVSDWGHYGGDAFSQRYSQLNQIHRENVSDLEVAWTYRTGELGEGFASADALAFEVTPVLAFGRLYIATPTSIVIALDPDTGAERWRYDPRIDRKRLYGDATMRGVSVWQDPSVPAKAACGTRVYSSTLDARLLSLDAATGKPCAGFGTNGSIDLRSGIRNAVVGQYFVTSPVTVHADLIIVGASLAAGGAPPKRSPVRAFDARTGALRWSFDALPDSPTHPATPSWGIDEARLIGGGFPTAPITADPARNIAYVPTGAPEPHHFGGARSGTNRFANSLVALDTRTGRPLWAQQLIRHDLWDYGLTAPASLVELDLPNRSTAAVLQATKTGRLFVFDRENGRAVFPIRDRLAPRSSVAGEKSSLTQPIPDTPVLGPARTLTSSDMWGLTFWDRSQCRQRLAALRNEGAFTPPDEKGALVDPGPDGGVGWGGLAVDMKRQRVLAVVNRLPTIVTLHGDTPEREPFVSPWGLPCAPPPWATLVNVDLRRNEIAWEVPLGSTRGVLPFWLPKRDFGQTSWGAPIVTAGDLVFVAASGDGEIRAFDLETGRELWSDRLPAVGHATPMTYRAGPDKRQYVVIVAGGRGLPDSHIGDYVVAYALPRK